MENSIHAIMQYKLNSIQNSLAALNVLIEMSKGNPQATDPWFVMAENFSDLTEISLQLQRVVSALDYAIRPQDYSYGDD